MLASYITELTLSISTAQRADASAVATDTSELLLTAPPFDDGLISSSLPWWEWNGKKVSPLTLYTQAKHPPSQLNMAESMVTASAAQMSF